MNWEQKIERDNIITARKLNIITLEQAGILLKDVYRKIYGIHLININYN